MKKPSLNTTMTILLPVALCIAMAGILFTTLRYFQTTIKNTIATQQNLMVELLADQIDQKLLSMQQPLIALSHKLTPQQCNDPDEALAFLLERTEFTSSFDNGMFLFSPKGRIVAELPLGLGRTGQDFSYREYLSRTLATGKPYISSPYISSKQEHHPAIMMTVPILDSSGKIVAVLGGSIDLMHPSFLGGLVATQIGKSGYLFMISNDRKVIFHPDRSRILSQDSPKDRNSLIEKALAGYDGTEEVVNSYGQRMLTSVRHLKIQNWILAANYPAEEANAPIVRLQLIFTGVILPGLLLLFLAMRRLMARVTEPLLNLTRHVELLPIKSGSDRMYPSPEASEIGTLSTAFNQLIQQLDSQQEALHRQNNYLLALHETTLGLIGRLETHSLLSAIIARAATLTGTEHGYIYLLDDSTGSMIIQVQLGVFDTFEHHSLALGEGMAGFVWETGKPFHVDDYSTWPNRIPDPSRDVLHAMAGVPLTSGGAIVGVIGLAYADREQRFDDEKMWHLCRFAELASLALDNARLYDAAQRELRERARAEESLRMLTQAVEQSPVSVVITDTDGTIEYANPYFIRLSGYSLEELLGQNPRVLKTGYTSQAEYAALWKTILSGGEWRGEFHNRKKNGELYWELALISPVREQDGRISHFISIKEDITDRKKLESELRHSQKMEAVGQLAGGIAHDFNNILTAIIGYASILQMKADHAAPFKGLADQILSTAERGASLTQGLLAFSRKQANNPVSIDLNEIVRRVEKLLLRIIGEDVHLTTRLWSGPLPVMADSMQIEQVLMNLATNARDAMPDGGTVTVMTELASLDTPFVNAHGFGQPGEYALMTISDTGQGMDEETVKRIFEPFFTTKETGKGTGLGLSIVYGIVKKHGGYITCDSRCGSGTAFRIYLPLTTEYDQPAPTKPDSIPFAGGQETILLAEDDETSRSFSRELLEEFGYSVIEAEDGTTALLRYNENRHRIRLCILDMIMPGMKGRDVSREILGMDRTARILFCSGYAPETLQDPGEHIHFIAKPYTPKELLMKIREVLDAE